MSEDAGYKIEKLKVDGGASRNSFLMQFQADIIGQEVTRPIISETTALGAAYLAGLAVGFWKSKNEIAEKWFASKTYMPTYDKETIDRLYSGWEKAVSRTRQWEED